MTLHFRPSRCTLPLAWLSLLLPAILLSACGEDQQTSDPAPVRSIKSMVIKEVATQQQRQISGVVEADTVTDLSFEISGKITKLGVDLGDPVAKNEKIAELDAEPYRLKVETARGELGSARAALKDAEQKFAQQKILFAKGFTTKTSFDTATATLQSGESQVKISISKLSIAERDLGKAVLVAPFTGRISKKYVDVFTDVTAGQKIVEMHTEGNLKVEASIPENLVRTIKEGDRVEVAFPTLPHLSTAGRISKIGSRAEAANAFPVKIALDHQFPELRPGISASVTFRFRTEATGQAFVVPATALLPAPEEGKAFVFTFDKSAEVVRKRKVSILNIRNNSLEVAGELGVGDVIAIAGVSFLSDGMKVRLLAGK